MTEVSRTEEFVPQGDPVLAEMFSRFGMRPQPSKIIEIDILATAFNQGQLKKGERVVILSCRHRAVTTRRKRMDCPRCDQLMRHGFDFDSWIRGVTEGWDGLNWRQDPVRILNEHTDLNGNFVDDPDDPGTCE